MADEFDDIMGDQPRLHDILTNEEVEQARAKARSRLDKERRDAAMKDVEQREATRLRMEEGLVSGIGYLDELVDMTIDLPPWSPYISVNGSSPGQGGRVYHHGRTYAVPRHVANSLAETMFRMWRHEDQADGKDLVQQYARKGQTRINARTGAVTGTARRLDA